MGGIREQNKCYSHTLIRAKLERKVLITPEVFVLLLIMPFFLSCVVDKITPPRSEIYRFEKTKELEIPEIYDVSRLRAGSMVKIESICKTLIKGKDVVQKKAPFYETVVLRNIKKNQVESRYIINWTGSIFTRTFDSRLSDLSRTVFLYQRKLIGVSPNKPRRRYRKMAKALSESDLKIKIADFRLLPSEELFVANKTIPCRVYQIQKMNLKAIPDWKSEQVEKESIKMWVSNEVPFGVVKSKLNQTIYYGGNLEPANIICDFRVVEFEY